jgi:hypothetical protein
LFGTQEQVDAESDLVERAVISVDVAANKESDMPQGAGPLGGGDQVELVFCRGWQPGPSAVSSTRNIAPQVRAAGEYSSS